MQHSARISTNRVIAVGFIILGAWSFLALIAIIIMAGTIDSLRHDQQTIVTPMAYNAPFGISLNSASPELLRMWAVTFTGLRLNVAPETVDAQHEFFLSFIKPATAPDFKVKLAEEARRIKLSKVTSTFYLTGVKVYPNSQMVDVRGVLHTWIGNSKPLKENKRYVLEMEYDGGVAWLTRFVEPDNDKQ